MKFSLKKLPKSQKIRDQRHQDEIKAIKVLVASIVIVTVVIITLGIERINSFIESFFPAPFGFLFLVIPLILLIKFFKLIPKYKSIFVIATFIFIGKVILLITGYGNLIIATLLTASALLLSYIFYKKIIKPKLNNERTNGST